MSDIEIIKLQLKTTQAQIDVVMATVQAMATALEPATKGFEEVAKLVDEHNEMKRKIDALWDRATVVRPAA